jgi:hypothetical protein
MANGAVGLYRAGDLASIGLLRGMVRCLVPPFQAAGLWAMGQTEDPRFLNEIRAYLPSGSGDVRRNALRALVRIGDAGKRRRTSPPLRVSAALDGSNLYAAVWSAADPSTMVLPDTAYSVWDSRGALDIVAVSHHRQSQNSADPALPLPAPCSCLRLARAPAGEWTLHVATENAEGERRGR